MAIVPPYHDTKLAMPTISILKKRKTSKTNAIVPPYNDTKLAMPTISTFMHPFSKPLQLSITTV